MTPRHCIYLAAVLVLAAALRAPALGRGIDQGTPLLQWRETDVAAIARNFEREGMNILYPRIDWRGTGPGYVEMEFPILPWSLAVARKIFGDHEQAGRILSFAFGMLTLIVFAALARALLPGRAALAAITFFALNPLAVLLSTAMLGDGLMLLCSVACVYGYWRWLESESRWWLLAASGTGALAILAKAPAVHLGILLLALLLWRRGPRALLDPRPWAMATVMLLPGLAWYAHAHRLWTEYGNSLGVSNERHLAGLSLLTDPQLLGRMLRLDVSVVWSWGALGLAGLALLAHRKDRGTRVALFWAAAAYVYLAAVARTSSDDWAFYYHVVALPPAALLVGSGALAATALRPGWRSAAGAGAAMAAAGLGAAAIWLPSGHPVALRGLIAGAIGALVGTAWGLAEWRAVRAAARPYGPATAIVAWPAAARSAACVVLVGCVALLGSSILLGLRAALVAPASNPLYACSQGFAPRIPESALLLSSSHSCYDPQGDRQASDMPFFFYWIDRKGFTICHEELSVAAVEGFAARGAGFFVATRAALSAVDGLEADLVDRHRLAGSCPEAYLFELHGASGTE